jgi:hypothetical protein
MSLVRVNVGIRMIVYIFKVLCSIVLPMCYLNSLGTSSGIQALDLRISSRVFDHCASTPVCLSYLGGLVMPKFNQKILLNYFGKSKQLIQVIPDFFIPPVCKTKPFYMSNNLPLL